MDNNRRRGILLGLLIVILLLLLLWWRHHHHATLPTPVPISGPTPVPVPPLPSVSVHSSSSSSVSKAPVTGAKPSSPMHKTVSPSAPPIKNIVPMPLPPPKPTAPIPTAPTPAPPPVELHKELIPKNITIAKCYYSQEIVGPGTTFGFDIDGSGFTSEFSNMIKVDPGGLDIEVKNLVLVTPNQIHGDMVVGPEATTEFIFPRVLIHNLPVFRAPDPFAVVRPGEVLHVFFTSMADNGRSGRFRIITNLTEAMFKEFKVETSSGGLEISPLEPHLPFVVEGVLTITPGVAQGQYGMIMHRGTREVFRRDQMIHIVRPNLGSTGLVQWVTAEDPFMRPGDTVQLLVHGSSFMSDYGKLLNGRVDEFDMGATSCTYISASEFRCTLMVPSNAPQGAYSLTFRDPSKNLLHHQDKVFTVVPPNWVAAIQITPPAVPGRQSALKLIGRDLSAAFAQSLHIDCDEPGIHISTLLPVNSRTLAAQITVDPKVAPGDYILNITANGAPVQPQFGNVIKVTPQ